MANYWECKLEAAPEVLDALLNEEEGDFNWESILEFPRPGERIVCTADHSTTKIYPPTGGPIVRSCRIAAAQERVSPVGWRRTLDLATRTMVSVPVDGTAHFIDWFDCHAGCGPADEEMRRNGRSLTYSSRGGMLAKNFLLNLSQQFPAESIILKACDPATVSAWMIEVRAGAVIQEWEQAQWEATTDPYYKVLEAELCDPQEGRHV